MMTEEPSSQGWSARALWQLGETAEVEGILQVASADQFETKGDCCSDLKRCSKTADADGLLLATF